MVVAVSSSLNQKSAPNRTFNPTKPRPPLLPSDSANSKTNNVTPRRSISRDVASRLLSTPSSSSASRRWPSPVVSCSSKTSPARAAHSPPAEAKRPQSAERRRPATAFVSNGLDLRIGGREISNAQKMLITSSRSLSVSFQDESFSYKISQVKKKPTRSVTPSPSSTLSSKAVSPERGRTTPIRSPVTTDHGRKASNVELQQRWPGTLRPQSTSSAIFSRSGDVLDDRKVNGSSGTSFGSITPSLNSPALHSSESRLSLESVSNWSGRTVEALKIGKYDSPITSDGDSISSDGSGANASAIGQRLIHGNVRHRRSDTLESPGSGAPLLKVATSNKFGIDYQVASPKGVSKLWGHMSPSRSRQSSPSKLGMPLYPATISSPVRGFSPSRSRNGIVGAGSIDLISSTDSMSSCLSFRGDIKGGNVGDSNDFHLLKILYNRLLQWRFVNARADAAFQAQRLDAEGSLYAVHKKTSKLRDSVKAKRVELQQLRQKLKLISFLNDQMVFLDEFALIEQQYSYSLASAVEALRASTLRLPVVGVARVNLQSVKDAISSAVDVMQAMASSICMLLTTVGEVNSLVGELSKLTAKERGSLDQCRSLLSAVASLQVKEYTLRIHFLQEQAVA